jgi:hypothetical protein
MTRKPKTLERRVGWHQVFITGSTKHGVEVDPSVSFDDLRADLDSIESTYGDTYSQFRIDEVEEYGYHGSASLHYYVYGWRTETDKEYEVRCADQVKYDIQTAERERKEYERLAKKFK